MSARAMSGVRVAAVFLAVLRDGSLRLHDSCPGCGVVERALPVGDCCKMLGDQTLSLKTIHRCIIPLSALVGNHGVDLSIEPAAAQRRNFCASAALFRRGKQHVNQWSDVDFGPATV